MPTDMPFDQTKNPWFSQIPRHMSRKRFDLWSPFQPVVSLCNSKLARTAVQIFFPAACRMTGRYGAQIEHTWGHGNDWWPPENWMSALYVPPGIVLTEKCSVLTCASISYTVRENQHQQKKSKPEQLFAIVKGNIFNFNINIHDIHLKFIPTWSNEILNHCNLEVPWRTLKIYGETFGGSPIFFSVWAVEVADQLTSIFKEPPQKTAIVGTIFKLVLLRSSGFPGLWTYSSIQ